MITSGTVTVDQIRERAYELWQADGCPEGRELDYWLRAEAELKGDASAGGSAEGAAGGSGEADSTPMDEPKTPRPARPRKAKTGKSAESGAAPTGAAAAGAAEEADGRGGYVQQKRTRRKAEG